MTDVTKVGAAALAAVKKFADKARAKEDAEPEDPLKPTTGQSGPALDLRVSDLNEKEVMVLRFLDGKDSKFRPYWLEEIAVGCWKKELLKTANSWTRNSLRRLVRADFVTRVERGAYQISPKGREQLRA